jgi:hypothetical protein
MIDESISKKGGKFMFAKRKSLFQGTLCFGIVMLIMLALSIPGFATMKMTPYLQGVTTNSIYVLVECDTTSAVTVDYGTTTAYGSTATTESTQATTASPVTYVHNVKLTGLLPNTLYHYRASQGGTPTLDATFTTAVDPGTNFRFAFMADCRTGTSYHDSINNLIKNANPKFSLYGGDLCYDSAYTTFKNEFFRTNELAVSANVPFFNTVGNHETWGTNTKAFTQGPSGDPDYYSFDYGDMHVLVMNFLVDYSVGSAQYNFVMSDLQNTNKQWRIVTCHSPAYCAGGHGEDANMKTITTNIFEPNKVDMVLNGHTHFYQHNLVNGIHHMVIGSSGAELAVPGTASYIVTTLQTYCYGIIDVTQTSFNLTVYNESGTVLDSVNLSKGATPTPRPTATPTPTPTPTSPPVLYETEGLTVSAISTGDTHTITSDANMSGGQGDLFNGNATNDYIQYTLNVGTAGTYNVKVKVNKKNDRGKYQLTIDGTNQGSAQDNYSASSTYVELDLGNVTFSTTGNKLFRFKCTGKNSSSSSYKLFTDYIKLSKQ